MSTRLLLCTKTARNATYQVLPDGDSSGTLLAVPQQLHPSLDQVGRVDEDPGRHAARPSYDEVCIRWQVLRDSLRKPRTTGDGRRGT